MVNLLIFAMHNDIVSFGREYWCGFEFEVLNVVLDKWQIIIAFGFECGSHFRMCDVQKKSNALFFSAHGEMLWYNEATY